MISNGDIAPRPGIRIAGSAEDARHPALCGAVVLETKLHIIDALAAILPRSALASGLGPGTRKRRTRTCRNC